MFFFYSVLGWKDEKTSNLSLKKKDTTSVIENASNRTMKIRSDDMNNNASKTNNEVTVNSLSISLINLFDRIKDTLCNIIDKKC